jgi:hypothetical protein
LEAGEEDEGDVCGEGGGHAYWRVVGKGMGREELEDCGVRFMGEMGLLLRSGSRFFSSDLHGVYIYNYLALLECDAAASGET